MSKVILIDNLDSFTYNLQHYVLSLGVECEVIRISELSLEMLNEADCEGIIISPGPGRPEDYPLLFSVLSKFKERIPILGICLGHQAIGQYFGYSLVKAAKPMHGKQDFIYHENHPMFLGIESPAKIMRYHSLVLRGNSDDILECARTAEGELMAIAHKSLKIWALQFHPESVLTPTGLTMLQNWLLYCGIGKETLLADQQ